MRFNKCPNRQMNINFHNHVAVSTMNSIGQLKYSVNRSMNSIGQLTYSVNRCIPLHMMEQRHSVRV